MAPRFYDRDADGVPARWVRDGPAHAQVARPEGAGHPDGPRLRAASCTCRRRQSARTAGWPTATRRPASWPPGRPGASARWPAVARAARRVHRRRRRPRSSARRWRAGRGGARRAQPPTTSRCRPCTAGSTTPTGLHDVQTLPLAYAGDGDGQRRFEGEVPLERTGRSATPSGCCRRTACWRPRPSSASSPSPADRHGHRGGRRRPGATVFLLTALGTVSYVTGRLGITDVSPVVSCGRYPARAVVGEHLPVAATVFREGHDAISANVAWRGPDGTRVRAARSSGWSRASPGTDRWHATVVPTDRGRVDVRGRGLGRPDRHLAAQASRSRSTPVRDPRTSPTTSRTAPGCSSGRCATSRPTGAACSRRRPRRCATPTATSHTGSARRSPPRCTELLDEHPVRELRDPLPRATPLWVDRKQALFWPGTSSSRARRAPSSTPTARRGRHGTFRTRRRGCRRSRRWASTSSTCRRSTRSAQVTARAATTR